MLISILIKQIFHVFEKFDVAALVAGYGNSLRILFYGAFHDLMHTPVMSKMNNFGAFTLHNSAHYINRRIMAIE
jgi:hypothetical protein